jgi:hypothetical protein
MLRRLVAVLLPIGLAGSSVAALAQTETGEPIRVEYHAGADCPDENAFLARVRERTIHARFVGEKEAARTFRVSLEGGRPSRGSVAIYERGRAGGTRRLEADSCDEVANGVALMVALALDPHALATPAASRVETEAGTLPAAAETPDAAPASEEDAALPPPSLPPPPSPPPPPPPPLPGRVAAASDERPSPFKAFVRHVVAGADAAVATGVAPKPLFAGAPFLGWRSSLTRPLSATVRVAFLRAGTGVLSVPGGSADFTWTVGRVDGCATLRPTARVALSPCARLEGGVLEVEGFSVPARLAQDSAWIAAGPLASIEWTPLRPLSLDAQIGSSFRLTEHRFVILPASTAYQVPPVGFEAEAGLGLSFP